MKVVYFYQHRVRELDATERIVAAMIEQYGGTLDIRVFQIDFEWVDAVRWARKNGVDVVVMPWLYHDDNYALLQPFISINCNVVICNLHQEQITSPAFEVNILPKTENVKNGTFHLVWGDVFLNKLKTIGVDEKLIKKTGNPRLDPAVHGRQTVSRAEIARKFNLNSGKKWLLFAENRGSVYTINESTIREYKAQGVSPDDMKLRLDLYRETMELLFCQLAELPIAFFDEYEFIYRPHPGTVTPLEDNAGVHVISELPISDWFGCIDLLLIWSSTAAFEAMVAGVPVVRHEPIPNSPRLLPYGIDSIPVICNLSDICQMEITSSRSDSLAVCEEVYGVMDGKASERTARALLDCAAEGMPGGVQLKLTGKQRKRLIRKVVYEWITRLFVRFGLLEGLQWPRSAIKQIKDIPYRD